MTFVHLSCTVLFLLSYVCITEVTEILYFSVKVFFHSIISIFFGRVEVIGLDNIPRDGPCIFVGNHANQFVDGVMLMATAGHKVSFLVAEKSWYRPIIGHVAFAMGAVPVARAQDKSVKCKGSVRFVAKTAIQPPTAADGVAVLSVSVEVEGEETTFKQSFKVGDKCRPTGFEAFKVISVSSDTSMVLEVPVASPFLLSESNLLAFDLLARVDQSLVYASVLSKLEAGGCIGIFPEGGSHDRTDLLPLKAGVALIAYSALEKSGLNIPIIPVGLNYFNAHAFRGKAIVEYG